MLLVIFFVLLLMFLYEHRPHLFLSRISLKKPLEKYRKSTVSYVNLHVRYVGWNSIDNGPHTLYICMCFKFDVMIVNLISLYTLTLYI